MNLTINNNKATTDTKFGFVEYSKIKSRFEGRTSLLKDGKFAFEATPHNLEFWRSRFPNSEINHLTIDNSQKSIDTPRFEFQFKREPMPHQQKAFDKFKLQKYTAIFGDVGSGKSKILSDYLGYQYAQGKIDAVIIVAINRLVIQQWHDSQLPRDINFEYQSWVWDKSKKAQEAYQELKDYNGLQIITMNIDALRTPSGKALCVDFIKQHKSRVLFAIDESQTIKSQGSIRTKAAIELSHMCSHRSILSGTPIAKNLLDYWVQFKALDEKIIGCKYASSFKAKYCVTQWNGFADEIIGSKNEQELFGRTDPYTFRITKAELGFKDFDDEFEFELGERERKHYNELKKTFLTQLDNGEIISTSIALTAMLRMQQVSNGFLPREDDTIEVLECSRLEAFDAWLETISDDKLVVWCRFKQDVKLLVDKYKETCIDLSGNVSQQERQVNKDRFIADKKIRLAIGTPKAAGVGVDSLQTVTNRALYYSNSPDSLDYWQSRARTSRVGGDSNAFYTHLIGKGTIDKKWIANLTKKEALSSLMLDDIRRLFE